MTGLAYACQRISQQTRGNKERSHGSLACVVDLTLWRKQRIVVAVSLTFLPAHPPRKRRKWYLIDGIRPAGQVESMYPRADVSLFDQSRPGARLFSLISATTSVPNLLVLSEAQTTRPISNEGTD
jgi:hypothetical protein